MKICVNPFMNKLFNKYKRYYLIELEKKNLLTKKKVKLSLKKWIKSQP